MPPPPLHSTLVLASGSPRRKELLERLGLAFTVQKTDVDETRRAGENPREYVARVARDKAQAAVQNAPPPLSEGCLFLSADTAVVLGEETLGKPESPSHAQSMLERLSGRTHSVLTAVVLRGRAAGEICVETRVTMAPLSKQDIQWYLSLDEPWDKAGAYALQGAGALWVESVEGSPTNVIGLPLAETAKLLEGAGFALPWKRT